MSPNKQLLLFILVLLFVIKGPFSSDIFTLYTLYSGFLAGCVYVIIFRKTYFIYYNLIGQIKSISITGWRAVVYGSVGLMIGIVSAMLYPEFDVKLFLQTTPLGSVLSFWMYKILLSYRDNKLK